MTRFQCPRCGFAVSVRRGHASAARALLRRHLAGYRRRKR